MQNNSGLLPLTHQNVSLNSFVSETDIKHGLQKGHLKSEIINCLNSTFVIRPRTFVIHSTYSLYQRLSDVFREYEKKIFP